MPFLLPKPEWNGGNQDHRKGGYEMGKSGKYIVGWLVLALAPLALAQVQVGDNLNMNAGGTVSFGYAGSYGDGLQSSHGLNFGLDGAVNGFYYNPNFINFSITPYYNQSRANSNFQSLTGASGVATTANLFAGSHFPGSVSYHNDFNSTGTFGLTGEPDFTTHGHGQGFGIGWSALFNGFPTLSVGYSQGSGSSTLYGTDEQSGSDNKNLNVHSSYSTEGFLLNAYFDRNTMHSIYPEFLSGGGDSISDTTGHDFGFGASHNLPLNGSFYASYNRSSASTDYTGVNDTSTNYTTNSITSGANFRPTQKLGLFVTESYTDNLSGYLNQQLIAGGTAPNAYNLGNGSRSMTFGGGANYAFTNFLYTQGQATYYQQTYFGKSYTGAYISGSLNYSRKLLDMFSFSTAVVESTNGQGSNAIGFIGNVNYFHRIKGWETSGNFNYAQNVQSFLVTYTNSYYNYSARLHRRFGRGTTWIASFSGSHSGLTNEPGSSNHSESYNTAFSMRRFTITGDYSQASGISVLSNNGLTPISPTPGLTDNGLILFNGRSYGGGISATPIRRLVISANYSHATSNTFSDISSRNDTEIFTSQLQYHLRRIGLLAGFTRFSQGIGAVGPTTGPANSYFVGVSRWFNFF